MAGKMLIRVNQLRERYIQNYNELKSSKNYSIAKYTRSRVLYKGKGIIFKTKNDCMLQKKIIESLDNQVKANLTICQLEDELDIFFLPYVISKQKVEKKELRDWEKELITIVQKGIIFYYPIENF